jgi:hypothetical protein
VKIENELDYLDGMINGVYKCNYDNIDFNDYCKFKGYCGEGCIFL